MRLCELFEAKPAKKPVVPATTPRNYVAKAVTRKSGSGSHSDKKYSRKEKHKNNKDVSETSDNNRDISDFL